jgi:hypothetical protein
MTTPEAAQRYLHEHLGQWHGRPYAVFNPHGKDPAELPTIYGFNNGGSGSFYHAALIAEDGTGLGSHMCSDEAYMRHDLGVLEGSCPYRHETFRGHYPDGYRMEFVPSDVMDEHEGLNAAIARNQALPADEPTHV